MKCLMTILISLLAMNSNAASNGFIVKLKNKASAKALMSNKSMQAREHVSLSFGEFVVINSSSAKSLHALANNTDVEYVEPNTIINLDIVPMNEKSTPSDASFSKQWGLRNTGRNSGSWLSLGKKGMDLNALKAWKVTKGDNTIKIAVIDTGIDWRHSDLKDNMMINELEKNGIEGVDDDGNGFIDDIYGYDFANDDGNPIDGHGHGTHCAGNIGAVHNGSGIAGIMAKVKILGIKFLTDSGSGESINAVKSIDYAIKMGVNVMSNSWGGGSRSKALKEAIQRANEAGITFVAAAGNSRGNNDTKETFPANYQVDNVVTVGAMGGAGKKAGFSNYGAKTVHVMAPGVGIYSTVKNNKYKKMSGTSMATPFVAGVIGLILANEPNLTPKEIRERLIGTSKAVKALDGYTQSNGRVDAYRALMNIRAN